MKILTRQTTISGGAPMPTPFWNLRTEDLLVRLGTPAQGLSEAQARAALERHGANTLKARREAGTLALALSQFKSPIVLLLLFAAAVAFFLHDDIDSVIILVIVAISGLLGFWQEYGAADAVRKLLATVQIKAKVRRGGVRTEIPVETVVPGDVVELAAGSTVAGDCRILEAKEKC